MDPDNIPEGIKQERARRTRLFGRLCHALPQRLLKRLCHTSHDGFYFAKNCNRSLNFVHVNISLHFGLFKESRYEESHTTGNGSIKRSEPE